MTSSQNIIYRKIIKEQVKIKLITCITARTSSKRLPKKALRKIKGQPTIAHLIERAAMIALPGGQPVPVILATTNDEKDDPLIEIAKDMGIYSYRGSDLNVLQRIIDVAEEFKADAVIHITGDDILLDLPILMRQIWKFINLSPDIVQGIGPKGTEADIISYSALLRLRDFAKKYFANMESYEFFKNIYRKKPHNSFFWTISFPDKEEIAVRNLDKLPSFELNTIDDFERVKTLFEKLPSNIPFMLEDISKVYANAY